MMRHFLGNAALGEKGLDRGGFFSRQRRSEGVLVARDRLDEHFRGEVALIDRVEWAAELRRDDLRGGDELGRLARERDGAVLGGMDRAVEIGRRQPVALDAPEKTLGVDEIVGAFEPRLTRGRPLRPRSRPMQGAGAAASSARA